MARIVNADPTSIVNVSEVYLVFLYGGGRIIMQYIAGDTVSSRGGGEEVYRGDDVEAVAAAIKRLVDIKVPLDVPGHIGGGFIIHHSFFHGCKSTSEYRTIKSLERQINNLRFLLFILLAPYIDIS